MREIIDIGMEESLEQKLVALKLLKDERRRKQGKGNRRE